MCLSRKKCLEGDERRPAAVSSQIAARDNFQLLPDIHFIFDAIQLRKVIKTVSSHRQKTAGSFIHLKNPQRETTVEESSNQTWNKRKAEAATTFRKTILHANRREDVRVMLDTEEEL